MGRKINIGFIGVGQIARNHLRAYQNIPDVNVVAAADVSEEALARAAKDFNIPQTYACFHEMLKSADIEAVEVCLHNNLHNPATIAGLKAGKHVYCEKPLAGTYIDAVRMVETAKKLKKKLHMQLATLYSLETRVAKKLIDTGQLGRVYHGRSTGHRRRGRPYVDGYGTPQFVQKHVSGGGALYDMGVYHIGQMLYLMGNQAIDRITGKTYQETPVDPRRGKIGRYSVEELGLGFVRFANGASMDVIEAWAVHMNGFESSMVLGSKGGIRLSPFGFFHQAADMDLDTAIDPKAAQYRWSNVHEEGNVMESSQHHWIAALQGRVPLIDSAHIGLNTMLVMEGIYLSQKLGREVTAAEVRKMSVSKALDI